MKYAALIAVIVTMGLPVQAASKKETDCGYQADVVGAVQKARIARVRERKVVDAVEAVATWPENYNSAIPLVVPWIYEMKMKDVKAKDLSVVWKEMCLAQ